MMPVVRDGPISGSDGDGRSARYVQRAYWASGVLFVVAAMCLVGVTVFVDSGRDFRTDGSLLFRLLPFFPVMLGFGIAAVAMGCRSRPDGAFEPVQRALPPAYVIGVLIYGFAGSLLIWQRSLVSKIGGLWLGLMFGAGAVVILVVLIQIGAEIATRVEPFSGHRAAAAEELLVMKSTKIYVVGGFSLIVWMLFAMWRAGLGLWASASLSYDWIYGGIIANAFGVTLGGVAVVFGVLQRAVSANERVKQYTGLGYLLGAALFTAGLFHLEVVAGHAWRWPMIATVGFILVIGAGGVNLWGLLMRARGQ